MRLSFYQAECGNAASMKFTGDDGRVHNIFVDAGFERTFHHVLATEIREIDRRNQVIDAWIISHIHDDHIGGVLAYLKAIQSGQILDKVDRWYYNLPRGAYCLESALSQEFISEAKSIAQGDKLASYLASINKLPTDDICVELETIDVFGLRLTILSPDGPALVNLRKKYPAGKRNSFERNEDVSINQTKAATSFDYKLPLDAFRSFVPKKDNSIENGSSISFIAEYNGRRILWLADSFPSIIIRSLERLGYSTSKPLECDWVNVAHHGSSGNNIAELYARISCKNYLISADGNNNAKLPTKASLASILTSPQRDTSKYHLYFTYDNSTLRSIFEIDGTMVYEKYNFEVYYSDQPVISFDL